MLLLKRGTKTIEREALKTGLKIAGDVVQGINIKQAATSRLKSTRPLSNGTIEPVSSLKSISTV
jgi:hypothetical protein